jgi:hypothetical protein
MNKSHLMLIGAFFAGVILAPKVRTLPVLNKLPSV